MAGWFVLMLMILSFFDYIFFVIEKKQADYLESDLLAAENYDYAEKESGQNITDIKSENEDRAKNTAPKELLDDSGITIAANESFDNFEIWNGSVKIGDIKTDILSQVEIFKRIKNNIYFGVDNRGMGGYSLFGGPREIYRLNLENNLLNKIFSWDCFVSDISPDEGRLISFEKFYIGDGMHIYLNIYDIKSGKSDSYEISQEYGAAGNAYFSKDGKKIVYETALNNPDQEEFAMFVIDLETREQKKIGGKDSYGKAFEWAKNN